VAKRDGIYNSLLDLDVILRADTNSLLRLVDWMGLRAPTLDSQGGSLKAWRYRLACMILRAGKRGH